MAYKINTQTIVTIEIEQYPHGWREIEVVFDTPEQARAFMEETFPNEYEVSKDEPSTSFTLRAIRL